LQFCQRQHGLESLYKPIVDKTKILTRKSIIGIEHSETGVTVKCADGSSYVGDIVVGADGVHSKIREEMWRFAATTDKSLVDHDKDGRENPQFQRAEKLL
jgi:2-polyprenyl-6-methoxyphenol hydroxylase-like FAD-dependent oxidoreductase